MKAPNIHNRNTSGIYRIRNIETGRCYIGSSVDLYGRWSTHSSQLKGNSCAIQSLRTFYQRNYTVVLLNDEVVGVAKRNKTDKYSNTADLNLAIYRAVKRLVDAPR